MSNVRNKKKKNIFNSMKLGFILLAIQIILTLILGGLFIYLNILPLKYLLPLIIVLIFFAGYSLLLQKSKKHRKGGKIFSIFISIILCMGCYYLIVTNSMFSAISGANTKLDNISIIVLKDDLAQSIEDAIDYSFGIQEILDRDNTDKTVEYFNKDLGIELSTVNYTELNLQVEALYKGEINAIIVNEAYRDTIEESYADFSEETRVLDSYKVETEIEVSTTDKVVTKDSFTVYISGIDTYGSISSTSRSDVNIIATINPKTRQILLTTTPRDYYVSLPIAGGAKDKLTHAGIYGVDASIETLESLYDINIDYYARVNFTTLIGMVDALGGITVNSEYDFTSIWGYSYVKGENQLNGEEALSFSRERQAFANGDNQRGINQTLVLKAMINKAISPTIITSYSGIVSSISESFETNMTASEISSLVKMQMDDMASWNIVSSAVTGTGDSRTTYSTGSQYLYVMIPDLATIETAKAMIQKVIDGEIIN